MFSLHSTPSTVTKMSPADMMLKFQLKTEISVLNSKSASKLKYSSSRLLGSKIFSADHNILILNVKSGCNRNRGLPGCVTVKLSNSLYLVKCDDRSIRKVSINNMCTSQLHDVYHPTET